MNPFFRSLSLSLLSPNFKPSSANFFLPTPNLFSDPSFSFSHSLKFSSMNIPSSAKIYSLPPQPFFSEPLNYFPPKYPLLLIDGCVLVTFLMTVNALEVDDKIRVEGTSASER